MTIHDDNDDDADDEGADPIDDLLDAMLTDGKPTLPWVVRWSAAGGDPVAAAWACARSARSMVQLIDYYGTRRELYDARRAFLRDGSDQRPADLFDPRHAARVRVAVPRPPALEALVARGTAPCEFASPVAELVHELNARGAPDPAWVADWSRDGADPVGTAWQASQDAMPMAELAVLVRPRVVPDLLLHFAAIYDGALRGTLPPVLFGPDAPATLEADALRAVLALRWTPRRELPAALRALRTIYDLAPPQARFMVEHPLLSAVLLAVDPPPTSAELDAALRQVRS